nr:unnamed protein product [Digitaria exilis]
MASSSSCDLGVLKAKNLRVLLPSSCGTLRIPDELAAEIGTGQALVVLPTGTGGKVRVWPVEVGRDGDSAFLGSGWPEFAEACGVEAGWLLIIRHRGRGVLTVKAFDASRCLRVLGAPTLFAVEAAMSRKDAARKPQFVSVLATNSMEKMLLPTKFVEHYIPKELLNNLSAIVLGPIGKVHSVKLEMARYEGNMIFTVKVFGLHGCQRESEHKEVRALPKDFFDGIGLQGPSTIMLKTSMDSTKYWEMLGMPCKNGSYLFVQGWKRFCQENCLKEGDICTFNVIESTMWHAIITRYIWKHKETSLSSSMKQNSSNGRSDSEDQKKRRGSMTSVKNAPLRVRCTYEIGPPAWIRKEMSIKAIKRYITFPAAFCNAIGFQDACMITFKTLLSSTRSWQVRLLRYKHTSHQVGSGWRRFCCENKITEGDVCTFNVIDLTLWHVTIVRR